jgi:hypothetical protein
MQRLAALVVVIHWINLCCCLWNRLMPVADYFIATIVGRPIAGNHSHGTHANACVSSASAGSRYDFRFRFLSARCLNDCPYNFIFYPSTFS